MIKVPDCVTELIEWDEDGGLTLHNFDKVKLVDTICFVPRGEDTPAKRTVRRHEFAHAEYDADLKTAARQKGLEFAATNAAIQAIGDVFVHVVYWPKQGHDHDADMDAIVMATQNLQAIHDDLPNRVNWNEGMALLMAIRSLSIMMTVGTKANLLHADQLVREMWSEWVLTELKRIVVMVAETNDREAAETAFDALVKRWTLEQQEQRQAA